MRPSSAELGVFKFLGALLEKFFAVDRACSLKEGMVLGLACHTDVNPAELQLHVDSLFPDGLSVHGERYLLNNNSRGNIASPMIELLFENVRRAHFPNSPSRFQSFFACCSVEEARQFRAEYASGDAPIWKIYSDGQYCKGNMRLLDSSQTTLICSYLAHEYWSGSQGPTEFSGLTEVVLKLPVTVGTQVRE